MHMEIRPLTLQDDLSATGTVYAEGWKNAYQRILPQRFLDRLNHERWSAMLHADPSSTIGLFEENGLIGAATIGFLREEGREGFGEIVSLYLLPEYTGQGYGSNLLAAAETQLHENGCEGISVWVICANTRALTFYMKKGYHPSGRLQNERYGDADVELMEMVKLGA